MTVPFLLPKDESFTDVVQICISFQHSHALYSHHPALAPHIQALKSYSLQYLEEAPLCCGCAAVPALALLCQTRWRRCRDVSQDPCRTLEQGQGMSHMGTNIRSPREAVCLLRQPNPLSGLAVAGVCSPTQPTRASSLAGLLRGDTLPNRDGYPGAARPADPSLVTASHLPPGLCTEGPGPHESQVRRRMLHMVRLVLPRC